MVMAFRRHESPYTTCECQLRQIDPVVSYRVTMYRTYEPESPVTMKGAALQRLKLAIDDCPASVMVKYKKA